MRVKSGITQKDLAEKLNVSFQTVSKWENDENEPDIATLKKLSAILSCTVDYLIDIESDTNSNDEDDKPKEEAQPAVQTIIIQQEALHVCEICGEKIPTEELRETKVIERHARRGRSATYRTAYYHKKCLDAQAQKEKEEIEEAKKRMPLPSRKGLWMGHSRRR